MNSVLLVDFSRTLLFPKDTFYTGSTNEFYRSVKSSPNFNFFKYFSLNSALFSYLEKLSDNYKLYLYTSETIQEDPALKESLSFFKQVFSAKRLGTDKKLPDGYKKIASILKRRPEEIIFIDDSEDNIAAAKSAGLQTIRYKDPAQAIDELRDLLSP